MKKQCKEINFFKNYYVVMSKVVFQSLILFLFSCKSQTIVDRKSNDSLCSNELKLIKNENKSLVFQIDSIQDIIDMEVNLIDDQNYIKSEKCLLHLSEKCKILKMQDKKLIVDLYKKRFVALLRAKNLLDSSINNVEEIQAEVVKLNNCFNEDKREFINLNKEKNRIIELLGNYKNKLNKICKDCKDIMALKDDLKTKKNYIKNHSSILNYGDYCFIQKLIQEFYEDPSKNPFANIKGLDCK